MHHEALLVMGSGGIIGTGSSETTSVDSLFHEVRRRVLELCRTCDRYAPLAAVVNDFYFALHTESRKTPYPRDAIAEQLSRHPQGS
jgi:hypothetical protein